MLTGDKGETALEIGLSCGLYDLKNTTLLKLTDSDMEATVNQDLINVYETVRHGAKDTSYTLAIEGAILPKVFANG